MFDLEKMTARTAVGRRIRELRTSRKFSQKRVAEELCISQAAYSLIENCQNGVTAEHIIRLSEFYKVTTDYILKGNDKLQEVSPKHGYVPFVNVQARAGFLDNIDRNVAYEDQDWFRLPGFNPVVDQKLFEVEGESMIPTILPGDVIICQLQKNVSHLLSGSLVLVVTRSEIVVKRFEKVAGDDLVLKNDNPAFDKQEYHVPLKEIKQVFTVRGKLTSSLVPFHQLTSQGKIQGLEESIERLQREVFNLQKKLVGQEGER